MESKQFTALMRKWFILITTVAILLAGISARVNAQEMPPRPPVMTLVRNLSFGAFYTGTTGGTVSVSPTGLRTSTGTVLLLGLGIPFASAQFNINTNPGYVISILNGSDVPLTWSGYSMNLHIGTSNPASPFVNSNPYTVPVQLTIGATLTVGPPASNPPGSYSGTFEITIVIE
jgi:Domain of unknown function (DUF4402)